MLKLCNSITEKKNIVKPLKSNTISIYVCGITPYDTTHLGHAFVYISFDVLIRFLKYKGYKVNYVQNVTDIDDDILKKAKKEKEDWRRLGNYWTKIFLEDIKSLNILPPTHYVKATESINEMITIITALIDKDFAYKASGNVYFDTSKDNDYGKLSKYNKKQMKALLKERGGDPDDPNKKYPLDFILWQKSKNDEPSWDAPFGNGRPGWHIECSAMVHKYLGSQIDIHGGGKDLIYPHHESEIAQSENFLGKKPFVKHWMHVAMVLCRGEKMSKSLGNLIMIRDLLKYYSSSEIRWYLLSKHYRSPLDYMELDLKDASANYKNVIRLQNNNKKKLSDREIRKFEALLDDDLNTPKALEFITFLSSRKFNVSKLLHILGLI